MVPLTPETLRDAFAEVARAEVDMAALGAASKEGEFIKASLDLLIEASSYVVLVVNFRRSPDPWTREDACVGGQMIRLYKLLNGVLDQTIQGRRELAWIFARLIWETAINLRYLIERPDVIPEYIKHSLRHERALRDQILADIEEQGGERLPVQARILNSIARTERRSGISLDVIDPEDRTPWGGKGAAGKAKELGIFQQYIPMFGGPSHAIHGSWQDLYEYHIRPVSDDSFEPYMDFHAQRPQVLTATCIIIMESVRAYLSYLGDHLIAIEATTALDDLEARVRAVDDLHERYLQQHTASG